MRIAILAILLLTACSDRSIKPAPVDIGGAAAAGQSDIANYAAMRAADERRGARRRIDHR